MKQKAEMVGAGPVSEYVHLAGMTNVLHPMKTTGWRIKFLGRVTSVEQDWERHP